MLNFTESTSSIDLPMRAIPDPFKKLGKSIRGLLRMPDYFAA